MNMQRVFKGLMLLALFVSAPSFAYQTTKVAAGGTTIYSSASADSDKLGNLPGGAVVNINDNPRNGFYLGTPESGPSGWIPGSDLMLKKNGESNPPTPPAATKTKKKPKKKTSDDDEDMQESHDDDTSSSSGDRNFNLGVLVGLGQYSTGAVITLGGEMNYKFTPHWGAGLYLSYASPTASATAVAQTPVGETISVKFIVIAPELNYYFSPEPSGFHLGVKLGGALVSTTLAASSGSSSTTASQSTSVNAVAFGGAIGYDYALGSGFTLGGEANGLAVSSGGSSTVLDFLVTAKYWF